MPQLVYTLDEFRRMHGGIALVDSETNRQLLPDGAYISQEGVLVEPPTEPGELLRAKRAYVAVNLRLEVEAFTQFREECQEKLASRVRYGNTVPGPPPDAKQQLERGATRVQKLRTQLDAMDREIANLPNEVGRRVVFEQRRATQQSAQDQLNQIAGVTI